MERVGRQWGGGVVLWDVAARPAAHFLPLPEFVPPTVTLV